jgi:DNA polymerase III delta prime subunit
MAIDWNKLISVEVLSTSAVLVFSVGVAYTTLANGQEQADAQIAQLQAKQAEMQDSIADIQRDTAVLNADQKHILKMVEEQRQDIRQILKLMQEGKAERVIAELAAFNAAFGVVKEFVANGRDLSDCFGFIGQMTTAKEDLKLKADKRGFTSDAEEFVALEQIKQAEDQLRELMQYYGRAGLWEDFVKFQAEARKARLEERNERVKKINQRMEYASIIVACAIGVVGMYALLVVASAMLMN